MLIFHLGPRSCSGSLSLRKFGTNRTSTTTGVSTLEERREVKLACEATLSGGVYVMVREGVGGKYSNYAFPA